jgi:uncharacterized membrane protein YeaQ/YmgE (transglycosylase-associated protein family)
MLALIAWIVSGIIIGALAKLVMPGRDPGGLVVTMLLGIAGAMIGGVLGRSLGFYGPGQSAGWIMSILGAILVLALYRMIVGSRTTS